MATTPTYRTVTLAWGEDERMLYLEQTDGESFGFVNLMDVLEQWGNEEPDYAELAQDVADLVLEHLRAGGWDVTHVTDVNAACFRFLTPGGAPPLSEADLSGWQFSVREARSAVEVAAEAARVSLCNALSTGDDRRAAVKLLAEGFGFTVEYTELPTL